MTLPNIVENALSRLKSNRRRNSRNVTAEIRTESLEQRALLTLIGAEVTISNSFQPGDPAVDFSPTPFGSPAFAVVESRAEPEVSQFVDLYDIDLTGNSISLVYNLASNPTVKPAGNFDIYEFEFRGLAPNEFIASATADTSQNLVPDVVVIGNTVRVTVPPNQATGPGQNALINLEIGETSPVSLVGKQVSLSQTQQSNLQTGGVEVPVGSTETATVTSAQGDEFGASSAREFDINVDSQTIDMDFNGGPNSSRTLPAGSFERYYFSFDLADNEVITAAVADGSQSLVPVVRIEGNDTVVVEFGPGTQMGFGLDALIEMQVEVAGSEVSGRIWQDLNNDSIRQNNEGWLNGFEVQLNDEGGNPLATAVSRNIDLNNDGLIDRSTEAGIYVFEGVQTGQHTVVQVPRAQWQQSSPPTGSDQTLVNLRNSLGLAGGGNEFLNYAGLNEKWVVGTGSTWYYITPDGSFYQWDGVSPSNALVSTLIDTLDVSVYNDLSLLTNASTRSDNVANVTVPTAVTGLNFGNYLAPPSTFFWTLNNANNTVNFQWHPAELLPQGTMQIWVADVNTGKRFEVTSGHLDENYVSDGPSDSGYPEGRYRVWARIEYSPGVYSGWSQGGEFEFFHAAVPTPFTGGLDAGIDATPTVEWAAVNGAVSYDVLVDSGVYRAEKIVGLSHRIERPLSLATHSISFRANFADGSRTEWSSPQTLTVSGKPVVQVNGNVVTWGVIQAATEYEVWVDRVDANNNRITRQVVSVDDIKELTYTLQNIPAGRYSVWVRAIRAEAGLRHYSFWSDRVNFQISASNELEELSPAVEGDALLAVFPVRDDAESHPEESHSDRTVQTADARRESEAKGQADEVAATTEELHVQNFMAELTSSDVLNDLR